MTTEEKNKWIEREKRLLEKQKEISGNKNASILSQITFCKDGVIIKKFMELIEVKEFGKRDNN